MRILLTHEVFAPDFAGGGEYILLETARRLLARGVGVTVLTTGDSSVTSYQGIPTVRLPISRFRMNLAVREIARMARNVDLIQTCTFHAAAPSLLAGKLTGKPVVCQVLGLFQDAWKSMKSPLPAAIRIYWERMIVRQPFAKLVFLSDYSRDLGIRLGAPPQRCITNSPGIDDGLFRPFGPKDNAVLFVGKLDARKGIFEFLEVARAFPRTEFRVVGWGPAEQAVRALAPPNTSIMGFLSGAALADAYAKALICLLPSKAETYGLTLVEAMASGCAIVSSIPLPFQGRAVLPDDVPAMSRAIGELLADRERTIQLGRENALAARCWTWDRHVDELVGIYDGVLKGKVAAAPPDSLPSNVLPRREGLP